MSGSQRTYQARAERFSSANQLIQSWADYAASNSFIAKATLDAFVTTLENTNTDVATKLTALNELRNQRRNMCFTIKDTNPDCVERRIERIIAYLTSEIGANNAKTKNIKAILKKIQPRYKGETAFKIIHIDARQTENVTHALDGGTIQNTGTTTITYRDSTIDESLELLPNEQATINTTSGIMVLFNKDPRKRATVKIEIHTDKQVSKSPSEKSFASLIGNLDDVITRITELSATPEPGSSTFEYAPVDTKLSLTEMQNLRTQLKTYNSDIQKALDVYGNATRLRKQIFDGPEGLNKRITAIKNYLRSLSGGKQNNHYIEFVDAIEGV